jgi:DASH complex subunit DAM1
MQAALAALELAKRTAPPPVQPDPVLRKTATTEVTTEPESTANLANTTTSGPANPPKPKKKGRPKMTAKEKKERAVCSFNCFSLFNV